jgi:hypothetical protein
VDRSREMVQSCGNYRPGKRRQSPGSFLWLIGISMVKGSQSAETTWPANTNLTTPYASIADPNRKLLQSLKCRREQNLYPDSPKKKQQSP